MKDEIQNLLNSFGGQLYSITNESTINQGDESQLSITVWVQNEIELDNHALSEFDNQLIQLAHKFFKSMTPLPHSNGLLAQFHNKYNDWASLQITDHTIYLIEMRSGQY